MRAIFRDFFMTSGFSERYFLRLPINLKYALGMHILLNPDNENHRQGWYTRCKVF